MADDTPHYLVGLGFLRITADMDLGYVMVPTFYTPTLLATIISPSDLGSKMGCASFTTFASLTDKDCLITLHHCHWQSQDIRIPLTVVRGLLYMAALHRPTDSDCTSLPPSPSLHVHVVGYSSLCGCSLAESSDIHPCLDGSLLHCACLVQQLACQTDVDYTSLHDRVDGLFPWPAVNSCICCSSDNSNSESLTYHLNHLTCDQLCLLWHQRLGHLHS